MTNSHDRRKVAVLVPCYNEELTVADVVRDFRKALPGAVVYVYDNRSTDRTAALAAEAGAIVRHEGLQGKGHVVRRMFSDIEADIYVMVDGDATYDAASAPALISALIDSNLDMVVGARLNTSADGAFRLGHQFGNRLLTGFVSWLFGNRFRDMLSGYRVFSRRFAKSFPALSTGFEIETELTVHALSLGIPVAEVDTPYFSRPEGSNSKLRTYRDGWRILLTILKLLKRERPFLFFAQLSTFLALIGLGLGVPVVFEFLETGLVPRFPTAILSTGIMILSFLCLNAGMILDNVTHGRREAKRLHYLRFAAPQESSVREEKSAAMRGAGLVDISSEDRASERVFAPSTDPVCLDT